MVCGTTHYSEHCTNADGGVMRIDCNQWKEFKGKRQRCNDCYIANIKQLTTMLACAKA